MKISIHSSTPQYFLYYIVVLITFCAYVRSLTNKFQKKELIYIKNLHNIKIYNKIF
jgi:hypothetical protein